MMFMSIFIFENPEEQWGQEITDLGEASFSKCPYVCLCFCVFVCLSVYSLLRYRLTVFLPPLPEVGCPIFLEIRNPWGKVMERSGVTYKHFCLEVV